MEQRGRRVSNITNYIAGELRAPSAGEYLDNIEPATGEVYAQVADSTADDVAAAVGDVIVSVSTRRPVPCVPR